MAKTGRAGDVETWAKPLQPHLALKSSAGAHEASGLGVTWGIYGFARAL